MINKFVVMMPEDMNRGARTLRVAFNVIADFLSPVWVQKNMIGAALDGAIAPCFFSLDTSTKESRELGAHRVYELAELMVNLQCFEGFDDRVKELINADSTKMEATYAELQVAGILCQSDLPFRFVPKKENPKKGENYDFDLFRYEAVTVHIEAKCKLETTAASGKSIRNALDDALGQLPKDEPAAIFVKMPQNWHSSTLKMEDIERATYGFFGTTTRVISVIYYTPFVTIAGGRLHNRHVWHEITNGKSRFKDQAPTVFSAEHGRSLSRAWINLMPIIEGRY